MFAAFGTGSIIAGGLVAAANSAAPFPHGSWLAAYLVLVCGVAQVVLGVGALPLLASPADARARWSQLALWNTGNLAVAAGVLLTASALVAVGSAGLIVALASCAIVVGRGRRDARRWVLAYHALVLALAVSVGVGCVLASATPS